MIERNLVRAAVGSPKNLLALIEVSIEVTSYTLRV